jgi:hypothetical protein
MITPMGSLATAESRLPGDTTAETLPTRVCDCTPKPLLRFMVPASRPGDEANRYGQARGRLAALMFRHVIGGRAAYPAPLRLEPLAYLREILETPERPSLARRPFAPWSLFKCIC